MRDNLMATVTMYAKKAVWITLLAFATAWVFKLLFVQFYIVPSSSMEPTIPVGSGVLLSKAHYGPRINDRVLPGFTDIVRYDIAVFTSPEDGDKILIKRCVGLPGETIAIKHDRTFINGHRIPDPVNVFFTYSVIKNEVSIALINKIAVKRILMTADASMLLSLKTADAEVLRKNLGKDAVVEIEAPMADKRVYPKDLNRNWGRDNWGPLLIPKKGMTIALTDTNIILYQALIIRFERGQINKNGNDFYINGKLATHYTFTRNYFFMMGDNRHN